MKSKRKTKAVPSDSDHEDQPKEEAESDSEVPEGINDLMNLPIGLLRKELISRKFQPTVINNLPHWQLSAMLRESTANNSDSFFNKIMGYSSYWRNQTKPAFTKKAIDEFENEKGAEEDKGENIEEEDYSEDDDVNAKDLTKSRHKNSFEEPEDDLDPSNYRQMYYNSTFTYYPNTLILDKIYKRSVPPEYIPPEVIPTSAIPQTTTNEPQIPQNETNQQEIVDDPNSIPEFVYTKLLNKGVSQSSIEELTPDQVKKIREEIKSKDFDVQSLIEEYNLKMHQSRINIDSQFSDTQSQLFDNESENANSSSESDSSSSSSSSSDSDSNSDKSSNDNDEKEDDEVEDDHMNEIY